MHEKQPSLMDQIDFFFKNYQSTKMYNFFLNVKKYFSMTTNTMNKMIIKEFDSSIYRMYYQSLMLWDIFYLRLVQSHVKRLCQQKVKFWLIGGRHINISFFFGYHIILTLPINLLRIFLSYVYPCSICLLRQNNIHFWKQ